MLMQKLVLRGFYFISKSIIVTAFVLALSAYVISTKFCSISRIKFRDLNQLHKSRVFTVSIVFGQLWPRISGLSVLRIIAETRVSSLLGSFKLHFKRVECCQPSLIYDFCSMLSSLHVYVKKNCFISLYLIDVFGPLIRASEKSLASGVVIVFFVI